MRKKPDGKSRRKTQVRRRPRPKSGGAPASQNVKVVVKKAKGLVAGIVNHHRTTFRDPTDASNRRALANYRHYLAGEFGNVRETSLRLLPRGAAANPCEPPRLAEVYVALDTKPDLPETRTGTELEAIRALELLREQQDAVPALQRLAEHDRLVLLGSPGSGKSTFVRHVALCLAQHALTPKAGWLQRLAVPTATSGQHGRKGKFTWPSALAKLLPIFVELRAFADDLVSSPPADLNQPDVERLLTFLKPRFEPAAQALEGVLSSGRAMVIFDGLDEVPSDDCKRFVASTVAAFAKPPFDRNRFVVTCRTVSYQDEAWRLPGFKAAELAGLDDDQIDLFIEKFYGELSARGYNVPSGRAASLRQAIRRRPELREMARTPYLLSLMAQLHLRSELPGKRALLFDKFIEELLFAWEEQKERDSRQRAEPTLKNLLDKADSDHISFRAVLSRLAFEAHQSNTNQKPDGTGEPSIYISEEQLTDALQELPPAKTWSAKQRKEWAVQVVHLIEHRTGLLVAQGGHRFSMAFKLQEFMAALHLCGDGYKIESAADLIIDDSGYWEEVIRLAAGYQAHKKESQAAACSLAFSLCRRDGPSEAATVRRAAVASQILIEMGLNNVQRTEMGTTTIKEARARLQQLSNQLNLPIRQRSEAASARGRLEDLPKGVGLGDNGLPEIIFEEQEFPAVAFTLAENSETIEIKTPYRIARYPVTVAQYDAFVVAGGYRDDGTPEATKRLLRWWGKEGLAWKRNSKITGPEDYDDPVFQTPNHPRVGVSWYEATAFCAWLAEMLNLPIRLPREAEWEQAARWDGTKAGNRTYPWGECREDELGQYCNWSGTGLNKTSAVGLFPDGKAACGALDMAGNVWEWCENWYEKNSNYGRVLRGGSWAVGDSELLSCSYRSLDRPASRSRSYGFRCVVACGRSAPRRPSD